MTEHPFLRGLAPAHRERLLAGARRAQFAAGTFLFQLNGAAEYLYLVERGRVVLEVQPGRGQTQFEEVGAGDLLGLSWLFPPFRWHLDARAAEPVEATVIPAPPVRMAMEADAALGRAIAMRVLAKTYERLERVRLQRLDVYAGRAVTDPMLPIPLTVAAVRREARDVVTLRLEGDSSFQAGQFSMLYAFGAGEAAISMSGDPAERGVLAHTIRRVGMVTEALLRLRKGDSVGVRGPLGRAWPIEEAFGRDVLVIAGGLGLAPLRPLVYELLRRRGQVGRVAVLIGARTPNDLLYRAEYRRWERAGAQLLVTVDRAGPQWKSGVGVVTAQLARAAIDPARTSAYVCGPEVMMRFAARDLVGLGVDEARIFLSMERNMKCAIGLCGHCQLGPAFVCKDGPVFAWPRLRPLVMTREC